MNPCRRKCWSCGNVADHLDDITPHVCCGQCGSQDTRLVKQPRLAANGPKAVSVNEHATEFDEAEYRFRQDVEEALEMATECLADSTLWWQREEKGPRTIETLIGMIVVAAKRFAKTRSGEGLPDELKLLVGRCEVGETSFSNDDMSDALFICQSLLSRVDQLDEIRQETEAQYKRCVMALQQIAQLADTGSRTYKERFQPNGEGDGIANGWRVAEAMREVANDIVGSVSLPRSLFCEMDRVRVKFGRDAGHYGTITHVGGDDGTYYGVKLDCHNKEMGFSEYELERANPDEPAWVTRFAKGKADCSPFVAKEIADQVRELLLYKRAMESMAAQFIHPKMTAREMAEIQLKGHCTNG